MALEQLNLFITTEEEDLDAFELLCEIHYGLKSYTDSFHYAIKVLQQRQSAIAAHYLAYLLMQYKEFLSLLPEPFKKYMVIDFLTLAAEAIPSDQYLVAILLFVKGNTNYQYYLQKSD